MIQIKKTILTLVALFAMTAGAWADAVPVTELKASDINAWIGDDTALTAADLPGFTAVSDEEVVNIPAPLTNGSIFMIYAFNGTNIKFVNYYNGAQVYKGEDYYNRDNIAYNAFDAGYIIYYTGTAPSGPKVAWDKAENTGSFTMPAGNVTLEPEYYPQATVADGGVTAADADARATTDDPLVKVDATKLTGAKKLMYFVSNSGTTAPAYDAEGWTDQLPNAEGFTQQGIVYVWYYPVGTDEGVDGATATYSDGDICLQSITARIAAAPTYAVTFAEGTQDADKWTVKAGTDGSFQSLPLKGVKAGTKVKLKYDGDRSMLKGVKAEKKGASTPLDNTTTAWTAGTYAVPAGGLTYSDAITVSGDVTLVLTDGETLTLNKGISLAEGATLTVEGNGTMNINGTNDNTSSTVAGSGMMCFKSGTLVATGGNGHVGNDLGQYGMNGGISHGGSAINGSLTLEGGNVTATGGNGGNAGGANSINCATGGNGGSAITGNVIINGGNWTANDGSNGTLLPGGTSNVAGTGGKAVAGTVTDNRN